MAYSPYDHNNGFGIGVDVPIGLADTAIGGQRIEEYMNNATIQKYKQQAVNCHVPNCQSVAYL